MAEKSAMDRAFEKRDIFMIMDSEDMDKYLINKYRYYPATDFEFDGVGYFKFVMFDENTTLDDLTSAMTEAAKFSKGFGIGIDVVINVEHPIYESHKDMIDLFVSDYNLLDPYFIEYRGRPQKIWNHRISLSGDEVQSMIDVCDKEIKHFMVEGLYHTAMRIGEFCAMRPHWIEMDNDIMVINIPREEGSFRTKTDAGERIIYVTDEVAISTIQSWFKANGSFGKSGVTAWTWCIELSEKAKLPYYRVTPHILRHSGISKWAREGKFSQDTVMKMAGHTDINFTLNYYIHQIKGEMPSDVLKIMESKKVD